MKINLKPRTGLILSLLSAVVTYFSCFTPVVAALLGSIGLGVLTGYLEYVLWPILFIFIGITIASYLRNRKSRSKRKERKI
jgi:mercuric ion transport protein